MNTCTKLLSLGEILKRFKAQSLIEFGSSLEVMSANKELAAGFENEAAPNDTFVGPGALVYRNAPDILGFGLPKSFQRDVARFLNACVKEGATWAEVGDEATHLRRRLNDELDTIVFLALSPEEAKRFEEPLDGWADVIARFPEILSDVEEANKCFALDRYAAAVFHGLQVVEFGLLDLGRFLKLKPQDRPSWSTTTNRIREILTKSPKQQTRFEKQHYKKLEQINGVALALQNAWRNKIAHAGERLVVLTPDFTPEIAEEILTACRAFMRRLMIELPPRKQTGVGLVPLLPLPPLGTLP